VFPQELGLHEEIAEDRMGQISPRSREHHLGVTRQLDGARGLVRGFWTVLRHTTQPPTTVPYPEVKRALPPAFQTRRVNTVVELRDGQSLVIGGLTSTDVRKTQRKIPLLGDIPVLGALFKNVRETVDENELVVLVSPHIIRPLEANEVPALPNPTEAKN